MNKANSSRKINKNLFYGKLHLDGLTLEKLGKQLNPPLSRFRVCQIVNNASPPYRLRQIASVLKTNVRTIFPAVQEIPNENTAAHD